MKELLVNYDIFGSGSGGGFSSSTSSASTTLDIALQITILTLGILVTVFVWIEYMVTMALQKPDLYKTQMNRIFFGYEDLVEKCGQTFDIVGISTRQSMPKSLLEICQTNKVSLWPTVVKLFTGSFWSHVAYLDRRNNDHSKAEALDSSNSKQTTLYVVEVTINDDDVSVFREIPWHEWLYYRADNRIVWRPCLSTRAKHAAAGASNASTRGAAMFDEIKYDKLLKALRQSAKLTRNPFQFWQSCFKRAFVKGRDDQLPKGGQITCVELVSFVLQSMSLMPKTFAPKSMHPGHLIFESLPGFLADPIGVL